jgi:hypothetical protein
VSSLPLRRVLPVAAAVVLAGLLVAAAATREVLARGELLPYTSTTVERVRVLGGPELWIARESFSPLDAVNGLILATGAGMAALAAALTRRRGGPRRPFDFFALLASGMAFLALDEQLGLHETIGFNLDFLADIPGPGSPEDVVFALYALPVVGLLVGYRDILSSSRRGVVLTVLGLVLFAASAALELGGVPRVEQLIEPSASLALVAGLSLVAVRHLTLASLPPDAGDTERDRSSAAQS